MEHKEVVRKYINKIITALKKRADVHDDTKLTEPEFSEFSKEYDNLSSLSYDKEEYDENKKKIPNALDCHYAKNRHHPEHYQYK